MQTHHACCPGPAARTGRQLAELGITRGRLRALLASGELVRVRRGVYAAGPLAPRARHLLSGGHRTTRTWSRSEQSCCRSETAQRQEGERPLSCGGSTSLSSPRRSRLRSREVEVMLHCPESWSAVAPFRTPSCAGWLTTRTFGW